MQSLGLKYLEDGTPQIFNLGYKEFGIETPIAEGYIDVIKYLSRYENEYIIKLM